MYEVIRLCRGYLEHLSVGASSTNVLKECTGRGNRSILNAIYLQLNQHPRVFGTNMLHTPSHLLTSGLPIVRLNNCMHPRPLHTAPLFVTTPSFAILFPFCLFVYFTVRAFRSFAVVYVFTLWQREGLGQQHVWGGGGGVERGAALQTYPYTPNDCGPHRGSRRNNVGCCCRDRSTSWQLQEIRMMSRFDDDD